MIDRVKVLLDLQRSYIFTTLMGSIDLSDKEGYSVLKMDNASLSLQDEDDFEEDASAIARENLLRSQKHLQQVRKRYEHALRRLRQKGYCSEKSLLDLLNGFSGFDGIVPLASTTWACIVKTLDAHHLDIEISDDMWLRAMDKLLILTNRRLLSDRDASIVLYCEDHILELYILLDDCVAQHVAQLNCEEAVRTLRREEDLITRADAKKMACNAVEAFAATVSDDLADAQRQLTGAAAENARLAETVDALKRDKRQLEKECYALRKENGRLSEDLASVMFINAKPSTAANPDVDEDTPDDVETYEQNGELLPEEDALPELPSAGIMFVGGHPNFLKKLRELYPNWIYLTHKNAPERMSQYSKLSACFICDEHMGHSLFCSVISSVKSSGVPYSYVKATNIDRVITEMRQDYAAILQEKRAD